MWRKGDGRRAIWLRTQIAPDIEPLTTRMFGRSTCSIATRCTSQRDNNTGTGQQSRSSRLRVDFRFSTYEMLLCLCYCFCFDFAQLRL